MTMRRSIKALAVGLALGWAVSAQAATIGWTDFTTIYDPTVGGSLSGLNTLEFTVTENGTTVLVRLEALYGGAVGPAFFFFDTSDDSIGIYTNPAQPNSYENDEGEFPESFRVSFLNPVTLLPVSAFQFSISIEDFYQEEVTPDFSTNCDPADPDNNPCYIEQGFFSLNGGANQTFAADPTQLEFATDGNLTLNLDQFLGLVSPATQTVSTFEFAGVGQNFVGNPFNFLIAAGGENEFALNTIQFTLPNNQQSCPEPPCETTVPEPATLGLLGLGLLGAAVVARRRRT